MPIQTLDADGRALSIALLDEAVGSTVLAAPLGQPVLVVATLATLARVTELLKDAKPLEPLVPDGPPARRVYAANFHASPAAEEGRIDFHLLDRPAQNGSPRNDPVLRLKNFSAGAAKAKKGDPQKGSRPTGRTAEQTSRPPRHRPSPTRAQRAPILAKGPAPAVDLSSQGRATTSNVTGKVGVGTPAAAVSVTKDAAAVGRRNAKAVAAAKPAAKKVPAKGSAKRAKK